MYGQAHRSVLYGLTSSDVPSRSPTQGNNIGLPLNNKKSSALSRGLNLV